MARRLKTYQTSLGFFDLAVAAPSMKAAADAWGARTNIFQQGLAKETHDAAIVTATMAKPGVVLRRPVGSNGPFTEHAVLPQDLAVANVKEKPAKVRPKIENQLASPMIKPPALLHCRSRESRSGAKERVRRKKRRGKETQAARAGSRKGAKSAG
jgi:colicin import membrane protein